MSESRPNRARLAEYYGVQRDSGKISDAIESKPQVDISTYSKYKIKIEAKFDLKIFFYTKTFTY